MTSKNSKVNNNKKVNFIIAGAAKCATTWLLECLREHPEIFAPPQELRYFSYNYEKGEEWYEEKFKGADANQIAGEKSPSYMVDPDVPKRIYKYNQDIELFFILRDPVERAYSHYCMLLRGGKLSREIEKELHRDSRMVQEGLYESHLKRYSTFFSEDQMNIMLYDNLVDEPGTFIQKVFGKLGVDSEFCPDLVDKKYHDRKGIPRSRLIYDTAVRMIGFLRSLDHRLGDIVKAIRTSTVASIFHTIVSTGKFPNMNDELRKDLYEYYREDIQKISQRVEIDLENKWVQ